ncbi:MAG: DNA polymerase III subunit beta [Polyangiaceae bacterium UTPRO1]|jgi:DNA polymerase-3 subunit beta|nr:DNA polymerase III subunit beta [Myxococcales bacterium]OQY67653.1 MAG: DNA polymerase III subunit beta [Polyangiaceae bacterium UTPRO1]
MDLRVEKGVFLQGLYLTQGVVEKRNTLPILANVLIEATSTDIQLTATDLEISIRRSCKGKVVQPGSITLNARKLYEIVRELPSEEVIVRTGTGGIEVTGGRVRYRMLSIDPKDFPSIPAATAAAKKGMVVVRFASNEFAEMIEKTLFAVSTEEARPSLGGVFIESSEKNHVRMVSTDGHRLAIVEREVPNAEISPGVILPRKGLLEVRRLLEGADGDLSFSIGGNLARIERDGVELFMRLIEGEFPDYRQVIPKDSKRHVRIDSETFLGALRRVSILASDRARGVKLRLESGLLEVATTNPDIGEAREEIEADYVGDEFCIGFNAKYLLDLLSLSGVSGTVEIGLTDEVSPGVLRLHEDEGYSYVVMPMRL